MGGLVKKPGIVRLPIGARVFEAIDKAGGALAGADIEQVNLSRRLSSDQIYYGDPTRMALLRSAGAERIKIFVVAINGVEASLRMVRLAVAADAPSPMRSPRR